MGDRPTAVQKAITMLEKAELESDPDVRAKMMWEPIIMLKGYINENSVSEHCEAIEACMVTHLCKHATRLKAHGETDPGQWLNSFALFVISEKERMAKVLARKPDLNPWYDDFMQSLPRQIADELSRKEMK